VLPPRQVGMQGVPEVSNADCGGIEVPVGRAARDCQGSLEVRSDRIR
jgi:hypothetical protein